MIKYDQGDPTKNGVYACRVDDLDSPQDFRFLKDIFLVWLHNQWWYCKSDQKFRGPVYGWIGPLQRRLD